MFNTTATGWCPGGGDCYFNFNVTNPATSTLALDQIIVTFPSGWTSDGSCDWDGPNNYLTSLTCTSGTTTVSYSTGIAFPPGSSDTYSFGANVPTGSSYPFTGSFSLEYLLSDSSYIAGNPLTIHVFDPTAQNIGIAVGSCAAPCSTTQSFTAGGSPISMVAQLLKADDTTPAAVAGVPVAIQTFYQIGTATISGSGLTKVAGGTWVGITNSLGQVTFTYAPDNVISDYGHTTTCSGQTCGYEYPTVSVGGTTYDDGIDFPLGNTIFQYDNLQVTTSPGSPTQAQFAISSNAFPASATHYIGGANNAVPPNGGTGPHDATLAGTTLSVTAADRFGNPISLSTVTGLAISISTTAAQGTFDRTGTNETTITVAGGDITTAGVISDPYYQLGAYRSTDVLTATISATTPSFTVSGSSGSLVTSTFDTTSPAPIEATGDCTSCAAGKSVSIHTTLATPQRGVPVTVFLDTATSTQVNGDGTLSMTANTGSNGTATAAFNLDTGAGATLFYLSNVADISAGTGNLGNSSDSAAITTVAGPAAQLVVFACYDSACATKTKYAVDASGTFLYINVALADKYGNPTTNTLGFQIQITLSGPGTFSATSVYIKQGQADTYTSFGVIKWNTPSTDGAATVSASSSLGAPSTKTVTIVSALPTFAVTSPTPVSGVIYSGTTAVTFQGQANVSLGYASTANIASVGYSVDGGHWQSASIAAGNQITWAISVFLTSGLHTIQFNATDDQAPSTVVSSKYTVLVDTSAPDVNFVTAANSNISSPATVNANIVDSMGDLNASSVGAVATNIDTSATSTLTATVTGSNDNGHSVSYAVTISGLTTGNWSIALSATDLAGNTNSSSLVVHVTVPPGQSFVVSGTASSCTLGGYAGTCVNYQNLNPTSQSVIVFAVWKDSTGAPVGIGTSSATVAAGSTGSFFVVEPFGLASGSYTVNLFVVTTGNLPVSITTTITVTV